MKKLNLLIFIITFLTIQNINSQTLKMPSGKKLSGKLRENFELSKIKIDVLKSELINNKN